MTSRAEGMGSGLVEALFEDDGDFPLPKLQSCSCWERYCQQYAKAAAGWFTLKVAVGAQAVGVACLAFRALHVVAGHAADTARA